MELSTEVEGRHARGDWTELVECQGCGLEYFIPPLPGDGEFYREASLSPAYYAGSRFEFEVVARRLNQTAEVLDIGCGDGGFLRFLQPRVRLAVGVDTNPEAVAKARKAGLDARQQELAEFARENEGRFDAACLFHLIEHLPRVQPFMRQAISCLKPGGQLMVAVPNRERLFQAPLEPLDCPPHHLSRWSRRQLQVLGMLLGLRCAGVVAELATMGDARTYLRRQIEEHFARSGRGAGLAYWAGRLIGRMVFSRSLYWAYRRTKWLERMKLYRHSMVAFFERPRETAPPRVI